jgi:3-hydroxyacyl-CoA dehydrogenase
MDVADLATGEYRPMRAASLDSVRAAKGGIAALVSHPDRGGTYAWRVLSQTLVYACEVAPGIADGIADVDEAMRLGFNWAQGPFELLDAIGAARGAERWQADGGTVPPLLAAIAAAGSAYRVHDGRRQALGFDGTWADVQRPDGVLLLADVRLRQRPARRNGSASVWDLGDGVLGVEVHTKMNALDADVMAMLDAARTMAEAVPGDGGAIVVYNEGAHFSVGANLALLLYGANLAAWRDIEKLVAAGQASFAALAAAPVPVVAAVHGMALGGGCELALHCHAIVAHVEAQFGLVETSVGLLPAWGGCGEMLRRLAARTPDDPMAAVAAAMELIGKATVAPNAVAARAMGFLRTNDRIVMNRDRLLAEAKATALVMRGAPRPAAPAPLALPGATAREAIGAAVAAMVDAGQATAHDAVVAGALAEVLTGGDLAPSRPVTAAELHALERAAFLRLLREPRTLARLEAMLATGKALRN